MRNILLYCLLSLVAKVGIAQNAPVDFETGGNGGSWTWTTFENDDNPALEIVANPNPTAPNTSATVAKFTARVTGKPWAGCESQHGADIDTFTLDASNSTIKIMVHKTVISDVGIKLVENGGASLGELKVANTKINEWEELSFDFSSMQGIQFDQIVVFPDFQTRTAETVSYFDNITFGAAVAIPEPTVAAADPTAVQADVISIFSNVYSNVMVDTWRTSWSNGVLADVQVAGNDVKKYSALDVVGIEMAGANSINASSMISVNFDLWTPNSTTFKIKFVDFGADNAYGGGDDSEHEMVYNNVKQEEWVNFSIPLSDLTGLKSSEHISQIILSSQPTGSSIIYVDNIYFSKAITQAEPTAAAADPNFDAANVISLFSNKYTDVTVDTWRTDWSTAVFTDIQIAGNDVKKYSSMDVVGIEAVGPNLIDASDMDHLNFDIWSPNSTLFKIKLVDFGADKAYGGGDDTEHELSFSAPATEEWINYRIPMSDFTGLTNTSNIAQIIMVSQPTGTSVVYLDNMFFSKGPGTSVKSVNSVNTFDVYPNPAMGSVNIEVVANQGTVLSYAIINMHGQTMVAEAVNAKEFVKSVSTSGYAQGVYMVNIVTDNGTVTKRLIIQ